MTSLTWTYSSSHPLLGCGVDAERIDRFSVLSANDDHPMPFVFSAREVAHHRRLETPARGFCASFCCKEALRKALPEAYHFPECELLADDYNDWQDVRLSPQLRNTFHIDHARARIVEIDYGDFRECLVTVYVFGNLPDR